MSVMRVCCPGSFDPVTNGHIDVFTRAARMFDEVVVLVTANPNKSGLFTPQERIDLIYGALAEHGGPDAAKITVDTWDSLLVDYLSAHDIPALVKGLRSSLDYEYELPMAQMNQRLTGVDTFFLLTDPKYGYVSSSICKEVAKYGGDVHGLLPENVADAVVERYRTD
jgi:pantetheine-phosphate adenylyltransferase